MFKEVLILLLSFITLCAGAGKEILPQEGVEIDIGRRWRSTHWAACSIGRQALSFSRVYKRNSVKFIVNDPDFKCVWTYYFDLPVDSHLYPFLVLKYRAKNLYPEKGSYFIWVDDGTGPNLGGFVAVRGKEIKCDWKIHQIKKDLRKYKPKGKITGIAIGIRCGDKEPAVFELYSLRFEAEKRLGKLKRDIPFEVIVVDENGKAVKGAKVIFDAERKNFSVYGYTDKNGRCKISPFLNENKKHMVRVEKEGMVSVEMVNIDDKTAQPLKIKLLKGKRWYGFVKDENGKPIAGATVIFNLKRVSKDIKFSDRSIEIMTDEKGYWETPLLPSPENFYVNVIHPDFISIPIHFEEKTEKFEKGSPVIFFLKKGVDFSGRILDEDGNAVCGAKVSVYSGYKEYQEVRSNKDGYFKFRQVPPGQLDISIRHGKYPPMVKSVNINGGEEIKIVLKKGKPLRGKVVNEKGEPLAGVTVECYGGKFYMGRKTDKKGKFFFQAGPSKKETFFISAEGYAGKYVKMEGRDEPYLIVLKKPFRLKGKIIDENGNPVKEFEIVKGRVWKEEWLVAWGRRKKYKNEEGKFEILFDTTEKWKVKFYAKGYKPYEYPEVFDADKKGEEEIIVRLEKGEVLKGKVFSPSKKPAGKVKVILTESGLYIGIKRGKITYGSENYMETVTDSKGNFIFDGIENKSYHLLLLHPEMGGKIIDSIFPSKDVKEFTLIPYGEIEGFAYEYDKPVKNCTVSLSKVSGIYHSSPFYFNYISSIDENGFWKIDKILPGEYRLSVREKEETGYLRFHYKKSKKITVDPGKKKFIVIVGRGGPKLKGRVTDSEGKGLSGVEVSLFSYDFLSGYYTVTDKDGNYEISEIEPGRYVLSFRVYGTHPPYGCGRKVIMSKEKKILIGNGRLFNVDVKLEKEEPLSEGDVAPDFSGKTVDGKVIKLSDFRGKPVLLDFWATWCGPCVTEIPNIKKTYEKFKDKVVFIGINLDYSLVNLKKFLKKEKIEWIQIFDRKGWESEIVKKYRVKGIPAIFLIDSKGKIVKINLRGEEILEKVEEIVKEGK